MSERAGADRGIALPEWADLEKISGIWWINAAAIRLVQLEG